LPKNKIMNKLTAALAIFVLGLVAIRGAAVAAEPSPVQTRTDNQTNSPASRIPFELGRPIRLTIQSPAAEWRGQPIHLVDLKSIQFELDKQTSHLTADIKADVRTFDNVAYDISVAVLDANGRLLGTSRGCCNVQRIFEGKSTILPQTVGLDFGISLDYVHAATFMVGISNRKIVTPEEWYKQQNAIVLTPKPIALNVKPAVEGWRQWEGMGDPNGTPIYAECLTALAADAAGNIWVGTSRGRVFSIAKNDSRMPVDDEGQPAIGQRAFSIAKNDSCVLQANLRDVQITSIAVDGPDIVWLATNDGIRKLSRDKDAWKLMEQREYYEGQPAGVSGGYMPAADGVRLWGYVDRIYFPPKNHTYAPLAVSVEHGLFCYGGYHGVWHHFMPHYWGPSSELLDLRELIPHRRATCVVEDSDANLWVGTQWDGLVRFNAHARDYHKRESTEKKSDGTEFASFGAKEVGRDFDRVVNLKPGQTKGIWAILGHKNDQTVLARFDGQTWTTLALPEKSYKAICLAEIKPNVILVAIEFVGPDEDHQNQSLLQVNWKSQAIEEVAGPQSVFEIIALPDGRVFAASWSGLYEKKSKN
jgi:hypothetical protein